ncbi:MAG: glycosyltransferase [Dehalococcoidia bacterium]|nr:glycosyltransferase [Dehalococcoidia bacterium]
MWHIYLGAITLGLSVLLINLLLNLRALHKLGSEKSKLPADLPWISVLIPARNEEEDIVPCLESLRRQDYPAYEILVLDDNSTDRTAERVAEVAAIDPRVKLIRGEPLPQGWAGKPHACHQLAAQAKGSWLLFTDADTIHAPTMLSSAMAYAHEHKLSLISGLPLQKTVSFSQRVAIPAMYFLILCGMPLWWVQGARRPKPGLVIGQFIFVNAADYHEVGGHEAVRSKILEDIWLGFTIARHGKRMGVVDLSGTVSGEFGDLWEGFGKFAYSIASLGTWLFVLIFLGVMGLFVTPFILMASHLTPWLPKFGDWFAIIVVQVVLILVMRVLVDRRFSYKRRYSISHPAGITFLLVSGVWAWKKRFTGKGVSWKDRTYKPDTRVQ